MLGSYGILTKHYIFYFSYIDWAKLFILIYWDCLFYIFIRIETCHGYFANFCLNFTKCLKAYVYLMISLSRRTFRTVYEFWKCLRPLKERWTDASKKKKTLRSKCISFFFTGEILSKSKFYVLGIGSCYCVTSCASQTIWFIASVAAVRPAVRTVIKQEK